jgi:hypothetical protein
MFFQYVFTDFQYFFCWILVATFSVCVHECFHAVAAYWLSSGGYLRMGH